MKKLIYTISFLFVGAATFATQPIELGDVQWNRKLSNAQALSKTTGKAILILFQEVPGCSTCRNYGQQVLQHPLIVEAIETHFVPLAIYNNKQGADAQTLQYFKEPAWNNPVVRIVNDSRRDIIPRISENYSALGLVQGMIQAIDLQNKVVPQYLILLEEELWADLTGTQQVHFSMYCFWTGEGALGAIDGVIDTKPGFMDSREVVTVSYDPLKISLTELTKKAKKQNVANHVYISQADQKKEAAQIVGQKAVSHQKSFRPDREPKYYLSKTPYRFLPMTRTQRTRANALIGKGQKIDHILSPQQKELFQTIIKRKDINWPDTIGQDFRQSWQSITTIIP